MCSTMNPATSQQVMPALSSRRRSSSRIQLASLLVAGFSAITPSIPQRRIRSTTSLASNAPRLDRPSGDRHLVDLDLVLSVGQTTCSLARTTRKRTPSS